MESDKSQEDNEKDDRCSFGKNADCDCGYHYGNILPIESVTKTQDGTPGKKEEEWDEERVVIDIGGVHRKFRLEGDERREERCDE